METISNISELPEKLLKAIEVAETLNVSRAYAYRLMQQGKIRTVIIGRARRVRPEDLTLFIEGCLGPPMDETFSK
jgi:excisionase family DNA binding protein